MRVRYDAEGDFLEMQLSDAPGYMRQTNQDTVMERGVSDVPSSAKARVSIPFQHARRLCERTTPAAAPATRP